MRTVGTYPIPGIRCQSDSWFGRIVPVIHCVDETPTHRCENRRMPDHPYLIDTHCHLDAAEFDRDRATVQAEAAARGVGAIVIPAIAVSNFATVARLAHATVGGSYALGIHPAAHAVGHRERHRQAAQCRGGGHRRSTLRGHRRDRPRFIRAVARHAGSARAPDLVLRRAAEGRARLRPSGAAARPPCAGRGARGTAARAPSSRRRGCVGHRARVQRQRATGCAIRRARL